MTQAELNRAVARVTGESVATICSMGFVPLTELPVEREPRIVDWDKSDGSRRVSLQMRRKRSPLVV